MPGYSDITAVDAAFARWVAEEDPPGELYPPALDFATLKRSIEALDPAVKVVHTVHATVELSFLVLAVKATKLVPDVAYAQLNVFLSRLGRLALVEWEWRPRGAKEGAEPLRGGSGPPGAPAALEAGVAKLLAMSGVDLVPGAEARRLVRVANDPRYGGEYYEITVFEALFGMGYPERQR